MLVASCHLRVTICHPFALGTVIGMGSVHTKLKPALSLLPSDKGGPLSLGRQSVSVPPNSRVLEEGQL